MTKQTKIGAVLIATGLSTPVIAYFVMLRAMHLIVLNNPGAPPNQGAMIQGYFALLASVALGVLLIGIGLGVLFVSFYKSRKTPAA